MSANVFKQRALLCTLLTNSCSRAVIPAAKRIVHTRAGLRSSPYRKNDSVFYRLCKPANSFIPIRSMHIFSPSAETPPAVTFDDGRVQELLKRMTGRDFDKIFAVRMEELEVPKYQLMSNNQLQEARKEMDEMADALLKMPPQPPQRKERGELISKDEKLEDFDECCYLFTDITVGNNNETRHIVVRETDGTLRHAKWSERDRMNQIYFPMKDRQIRFPSLLEDENLPRVFDQLRHVDVLDLVCLQCPPDSADYVRIHKRAHADLLWRENYDLLYSTRHYGPYLWFLASKHLLQGVLKYFLTTGKETSAIDIVKLHHIMFPKKTSATHCSQLNITGLPMVKDFAQSMDYDIILKLLAKKTRLLEDDNKTEKVNTEQTATS